MIIIKFSSILIKTAWWKLFLYRKFMFSMHIFTACGLTVRSPWLYITKHKTFKWVLESPYLSTRRTWMYLFVNMITEMIVYCACKWPSTERCLALVAYVWAIHCSWYLWLKSLHIKATVENRWKQTRQQYSPVVHSLEIKTNSYLCPRVVM